MKELFQRITIAITVLLSVSLAAHGVPARPGQTRLLTLADGTTVSARLVGDEFCHYWLAQDGKAYQEVGGTYQTMDLLAAREKGDSKRNAANERRQQRLKMPGRAKAQSNYVGKKKGIIILVNFSDKNMAATQQDFDNIANTVGYSEGYFCGSMYDYFYAQSEGQFELNFDVVGPYTVSKKQSYYGQNDKDGNDLYPATMVIEALKLADDDVNYADYDWDGDGTVDQVYVVYAGDGEADGGAASTIWPHEFSLSSAKAYYADGSGRQRLDGVYVDTYACGPELDGYGDTAGIGTMCHEFSHCLGYPDFYDTDYSGGQGMGYWDLMDNGSYNGFGYCPAGYTAYERWVAGWKTPVELTEEQTVDDMKALQEGGNAYIIYNKGNQNEYFILENRQQTGWDSELPGKGLLILHVDYSATAWINNVPNDDPDHQRMTWIAADNKYQYETYEGDKYYTFDGMATDTYPNGQVNAFGRSTTPAAKLYNKNTDGTYYLDCAVTDITQNDDGTIAFTFATGEGNSGSGGDDVTPGDGNTFKHVDAVADMVSGKRYIIACASKETAAGEQVTSGKNNYLSPVGVTVSDDVITIPDNGVAVFVVEGDDETGWAFRNEQTGEYLYSNAAKSVRYYSDKEYWTLADGTDGVVMQADDTDKKTTMLYNATSPRFTTYSSSPSSSMIQANLYMETGDTTPGQPGDDPATEKKDVTLTFSATEAEATVGEPFTAPTLTVEPEGAAVTVTYSSSDTAVAEVDAATGAVTPVAEGTTVITATFDGDDSYNAATAAYTLTVKAAAQQEEPGETADNYEQVFDSYVLADGDEVLIAYLAEDGTAMVMGKTQKTNNRAAVEATVNADLTITPDSEAQVVVLERTDDDQFRFRVDGGYLYAASSTANWLRTEQTPDDNANATITFDEDGNAVIAFKGTNTRNMLRFNPNNGTPIFACYAETSSIQNLPAIFRKVSTETDPDNPTTAITTATASSTAALPNVYTIDGRKVNAAGRLAPGIYIIDGRKVVKQ